MASYHLRGVVVTDSLPPAGVELATMSSSMEVPNKATKIAGGEGSQITDTQPANSPKLTSPLEFHKAEEIKILESTVTELKQNVKELTGTVQHPIKKIENGEPNFRRTKNSKKP